MMLAWIIDIGIVITVLLWCTSLILMSKTLKASAEKQNQIRIILQKVILYSGMLMWITPPKEDADKEEFFKRKRKYRLAVRSMAIQLAIVASITATLGLATIPWMPKIYISLLIVCIGAPIIGLHAFYFFLLYKLLDYDFDQETY